MPNPKGTPENLKPFTTDRDKPLNKQLNLRVSESMMDALKALDNYPEFCRQAIQKALDELNQSEESTEE